MHLLWVDGEQLALPVRRRLQARLVIEQRAADRLRTTALQLQAATDRQHALDQLQLTLIERLRLGQRTAATGVCHRWPVPHAHRARPSGWQAACRGCPGPGRGCRPGSSCDRNRETGGRGGCFINYLRSVPRVLRTHDCRLPAAADGRSPAGFPRCWWWRCASS
jgi:hypothetical protein